MEHWQRDRVASALAGTNPTVLARLDASFAVIGDVQFLPGYSVAITDTPGVERLSDLDRPARSRFLGDMDLLGEAVERTCAALDPDFLRVNLEILGNRDGFLHAHVWPRYGWEHPENVHLPVWLYPTQRWTDPTWALSDRHADLRARLTATTRALRAC